MLAKNHRPVGKNSKKVVEKMITGLGLSNDVMDETIEKIYGIAAEYREAGNQERLIERQLKMSLAGVKKTREKLDQTKKA